MSIAGHTRRVFGAMLAEGPILLSGGFGTELQRRGVDTRLPLWAAAALLDDPDAVRRLHVDYLRAGARILTANTFRTDPRTVESAARGADATALTATAIRLAREAVAEVASEKPVLIAGSVGPLADCYRPDRVPSEAVLRRDHLERVAALASTGAELLLVETMNTSREALAVLASIEGRLPAFVSFVCGQGGRLLSGESIADAVRVVEPYGPLALLVNCCAPPVATQALEQLLEATDRPVGVYANGQGHPDDELGWRFEGGTSDEEYLSEARRWLARGARLVGGCCGTSPLTIRGLCQLVGNEGPLATG